MKNIKNLAEKIVLMCFLFVAIRELNVRLLDIW